MHEAAIVRHLISAAQDAVREAGQAGRIARLSISVGKLSCASPDAMQAAFEVLSAGTPLEGAALVIDTPAAVCRCRQCGGYTEMDDLFAVCPRCGSGDVSLEGGRDLLLTSIDVEDADAEAP